MIGVDECSHLHILDCTKQLGLHFVPKSVACTGKCVCFILDANIVSAFIAEDVIFWATFGLGNVDVQLLK